MLRVVKIGGAALGEPAWLSGFAEAAAAAAAPMVIVHGGGPDISALSDRLGIPVQWQEGRRITPPEALDVAAMVLNGRVNKKVVSALIAAGVDALGLSGVDGGLLRAELVEGGALGRVGSVAHVRAGLVSSLLHLGHSVVVSPISLGLDGQPLNVNADDAAAAIAAALGAAEIVFLTDVAGVLDRGVVQADLDSVGALSLIRSGTATGGMRVKLSAAMAALAAGVPAARIGDARVLYDESAGTRLRTNVGDVSVSIGAA